MKGDLSRETFDRALHHSAVRLQQGRIVTDADWNEQAEITRYRDQRFTLDAIGASGAPLADAGFGLAAATHALAVHAVDADTAWVLAEDGALLVSNDGGASWTLVDLQTAEHLRAAQQQAGTGWIVGDRGLLRRTTDFGLSWLAQDAGTLHSLRGVAVFDADHAWAVGDGGIVVRTSDSGATWTLAQSDAAALHGVHFVDAQRGIAVGRRGAIVATGDGGASWTRVASGSSAHLRAIAGFGSSLVWAAGQGGTVLRSTDFGASWLVCNTGSTADLHGIAFRDQNQGWAVGDGGVVLHSSNGGANWAPDTVAAGSGATLRGITLFGNEAPWVAGDGNTVLRVDAFSPVQAGVTLPAVNLAILPGRCYVGGILCELEARASYAQQPDGGAGERLAPGTHLLVLNAWQRHLSAIEAPAIREVALGGPDTATRTRTVAQVRALALADASPQLWNCDSVVAAWDALLRRTSPRLAARAEPQLASANLCDIAATAGYRRLENQLYRVEVHTGGAAPTFKWSRENASVAYAVLSVSVDSGQQRTTIRLAARGRDANLDLAAGDRVELIDDDAELTRRAGVFFEYLHDGNDELELVLAGVPSDGIGLDPLRHPLLRRWDQRPTVAGSHLLALVEGSWLPIEEGVQVRFEAVGGDYRPGDHWLIPARTISADVEWPLDADGDPLARPPLGVADAYMRLGIVEVAADGSVNVVSDCRDLFPPLTALEQLLYVSGDGQDAPPRAVLPQLLRLRVARGSVASAGRGVRFSVDSGGGAVGSAGGAGNPSATVLEMATDANGLAACRWALGPAAAAPNRFQRVRASLIDADGNEMPGQELVFCASASLALHYAGGDGQQAQPGTQLAQALQVRVSHGGDGVAGITLNASVEQGGGALVGANPMTTDAQGRAGIGWQLGGAGAQRLTIELRDDAGQVLQTQSFNASAQAPAAAGRAGCDVTIGNGGDFDALSADVLRRILEQGRGSACICFLPGRHRLEPLELDSRGRERLSLHGCGRASLVDCEGALQLRGFAAVELRDLVLTNRGQDGVVLDRNADVRLSNLMLDRGRDGGRTPLLRVTGAQRLVMHHCDIVAAMPGLAALFEEITVDCRIADSRFDGIVSFYGDSGGVNAPVVIGRLRARVGNGPALEVGRARLIFCNNSVSMLAVDAQMAGGLVQGGAANVFASAVLHGNTFAELDNLFAAGLLSFSNNSFMARLNTGASTLGVMVANRATAASNLAIDAGDAAATQLHFVTPSRNQFSRAANQLAVNPLVPL